MKQKGGSGIEKRMVRQYLVLVLPGMIIFTVGLIIPYFCLSGIPLQTGTA